MNQPFSLFLSRVVASLLAMVLALSAIGLFLVWAARSVDQEDIRRQGEIAGYALREIRTNLSHNQESSTFWDEAVERTAVSGNDEWIDGNLGSWMHTFFGVDEAYVLDGQDQPIYSFADNQIKPAGFFEERRDLLRPYLQALRSKLATEEAPIAGSHEQSVGVSDYLYVAGQPAVLSVKPIVSDSGRLSQSISTIHIHVAIQYLEGDVIRRVGQAHVLQDLKFVPAGALDPDAASVTLTGDTSGATVPFEWVPYQPGRRLLASLLPILALVASTLMVGTLLISSASYRRKLDRIKNNEHIRYLASHDPLTGLPNRAAYEKAADELVDQFSLHQQSDPLAFLFMDLDRFKQVNDILGHQIGDAVLVEFARRTAGILPANAPVYRVGGDEFAALIPHRTKREVEQICSEIIDSLAEPMEIEGRRAFIGVSIGVSMAPHHGTDRPELNRKADVALYHAKLAGRRRFSIFGSQMDDAIQNRAAIEADLREALRTKIGLSVVYQPKFASDGDRVLGAEALVRWQHPGRGAISPVVFIPIAEEAGLIGDLGLWVLETACREAVAWPVDHLAVNVSPIQLRDPEFVEAVSAVLSRTGFPAERLELEMTETDFADSEEVGLQNIKSLNAKGIAIAIDDFGTGSSTFERLRDISFDRIKIDRSFVKNITESEGDAEIVRAMISMAHAKGLKTTAEGVETPEQRDVLRAFGCDELQGFLMGKPMPPTELSQIFKTSAALAV
ncbi:putative bifunctional diguanylate cyclase/phosphodiesterase [Pleomorphomonas oryzae]|uniref:putative bifunctional diguanylate cyclase/phosphodiesterase n=1 Tax=Pleomorphomonas oryzae TaxID=261934 RepID=UPI00040F3CAB|nr:EAL domain-containing protein [Pleomorphomonas oryzae]